jgi:hypothetical protein
MEVLHTAISFRQKSEDLRKLLRSIRYNPDLHKMLKNIDNMITELSKLESTCRHHSKRYQLEKPTNNLLKSLDHLEKLILVAKLMD